ncbi:MAG TPA: hypothetical protein VH309_02020 [Elusimicrobiota bacterium]|nr:hypothetical protein [Elusimicrobiota bacterium]
MPDTRGRTGDAMNLTIRRALLLAAALAVPAAAQNSAEGLAASAGARFAALAGPDASAGFRPTLSAGMPRLDAAGEADIMGELRDSSSLLFPGSILSAAAAQTADLDLALLLNRHLKTSLRYQLSGRTVWFSGAFDSAQTAYVSVLVDGSAPVFFNVKALLGDDQHLTVGGVPYTLSLSPNIFHKMKSKINLKNDANARETARFSVQDMLDAVSAAGLPIALSGQSYKFYYADGVDGRRMFVFIHGDSKDFHVYLIPENQVPADRMGVFTLFGGKKAGLSHRGTSLQIYENP